MLSKDRKKSRISSLLLTFTVSAGVSLVMLQSGVAAQSENGGMAASGAVSLKKVPAHEAEELREAMAPGAEDLREMEPTACSAAGRAQTAGLL